MSQENPWWGEFSELIGKYGELKRRQFLPEVKFTDRVVKQPKNWASWLDFCNKNGLDELTITTKTVQERQTLVRVMIHFEPTALYMYQLGEITG